MWLDYSLGPSDPDGGEEATGWILITGLLRGWQSWQKYRSRQIRLAGRRHLQQNWPESISSIRCFVACSNIVPLLECTNRQSRL